MCMYIPTFKFAVYRSWVVTDIGYQSHSQSYCQSPTQAFSWLKSQGGAWESTAMVPSFLFRMYVGTTRLDVHQPIVYMWYSTQFWSPPVRKRYFLHTPTVPSFLSVLSVNTLLRHGLVYIQYLQKYWWAVLCMYVWLCYEVWFPLLLCTIKLALFG